MRRWNPISYSSSISVEIADFGFTILNTPDYIANQDKCGTPGYAAPEIYQKTVYNEKVDIFGVGAILFKLLTGLSLIKGESLYQII